MTDLHRNSTDRTSPEGVPSGSRRPVRGLVPAARTARSATVDGSSSASDSSARR